MKTAFALILLLQISAQIVDSRKIAGCYWGSWTNINQIDIKICTHAYFAFFETDANGVITSQFSDTAFRALKSQNPSVKLLASIGGAHAGPDKFSAVANDPVKLSRFVNNCVLLAQRYDGIDIDWEYPKDTDKPVFVNMLNALRAALKPRNKLLAIAAGAGEWRAGVSYDIPKICSAVDIMNLMTYDFNWPLDKTGPNAGLSAANSAIDYWLKAGCPPEKLVVGLASYGYKYQLTNSWQNGVNAPATFERQIPYYEVCQKINNEDWTKSSVDSTPYIYRGNEWISYDDLESINEKLYIVYDKDIAGAFFWSIDQDDYSNACGDGAFLLVKDVYDSLNY